MYLFIATLVASMATLGCCGNHTVTDEAWFEVEIKNLDGPGIDYNGRFTVALFGEAAPITVLNFKSLAKGHKVGKETLHYKNSIVHRVVPDFVVQMGDITIGDGTGGKSIYGDNFNDEEFILSHRSPGWVAMANHGQDTNGSQFYITLSKLRWLDGSHVVFGKIIKGFEVIEIIGDLESDKLTSMPKKRVRISDCGVNRLDSKYEIAKDQLDSTEDL